MEITFLYNSKKKLINTLYTYPFEMFRHMNRILLNFRPGSGCPHVTSRNQDRSICLLHLINPFQTATETIRSVVGTHDWQVCPRTVRKRLRDFHLRSRRPYVGPMQRRYQCRMQWLLTHARNWFCSDHWRRMLVNAESGLKLYALDGYSTRLHSGTRMTWGWSVILWAGITQGVKLVVILDILTAVTYRNQVLWTYTLPLIYQRNLTFQQDTTKPYVARVCRDFMAQNNVPALDCAAFT